MKPISQNVRDDEVEFTAMRAQGPGGQNVNKVESAVHLRFDIHASSLAPYVKEKLIALGGKRVSKDGVLVIKAQTARTQEQNRQEARTRLDALVEQASQVQAVRRPTKPTYGSKQRRLQGKAIRSEVKALRGKVE